MPTPAVIAGLAMAAILSTGLLALGAYTVHRYMNWRCGELIDLFQRNTVRVVKIEDIESYGRKPGKDRNEEKGKHASAMEQMPERFRSQQRNDRNQHMVGLRGGFDQEDGPQWVQQRQMQSHIPLPAPVHAYPAPYHRTLEWHQSATPQELLWQPPAVFQQIPPQGSVYAYIPPHPDIAAACGQPMFAPPRPQRGFEQSKQDRTSESDVKRTVRERKLDPATASLFRALVQPISLEGDSIEVVDGYPFVAEGVIHTKRQVKGKKKRAREAGERRRSSSTELGTCSSSRSVKSVEDTPRDYIPEGHPDHAYLPPDSFNPYQEYARDTARAEGIGKPHAQQSYRSRSRRKRE